MAEARGDQVPLADVLPGGAYPLIVRPVGSHAGKGLARVDGPEAPGRPTSSSRA